MEAVVEAVKAARYNEAVVVRVGDDEDRQQQDIILTAVLDSENGGIVWRDATSAAIDMGSEEVGIIRHLRTKRWVLPMLNDNRRNRLYEKAIQAASAEVGRRWKINTLHPNGSSDIHVLDIGSGTGLLAMLACKYTEDALRAEADPSDGNNEASVPSVRVTTVEMAASMARLAKKIVAANKMQDRVTVVEGHSTEINLSGDEAHFCTSELLESGLLGEGIIPAMRDAWEHKLRPNAVVVPQRARVYAQLIESRDFCGQCRGPIVLHDKDSSSIPLKLHISSDEKDLMLGGTNKNGVIIPVHANMLLESMNFKPIVGEAPSASVLSDPVLAMEFDFSSRDALPPSTGRSKTTSCTANVDGVVHGVLFWWELDLHSGIDAYSTQPGIGEWQDHWHQCIYVLPASHDDCIRVSKGAYVQLTCMHNDYRIDFSVGVYSPTSAAGEPLAKRQRSGGGANPPTQAEEWISPDRALQLNDHHRVRLLRQTIREALDEKGRDACLLDLSDFSLCSIVSALEGAMLVTSVESSTGRVPELSARVAQIANGLPLSGDQKSTPKFQIVQCHMENLSLNVMYDTAASIVTAEPYYEVLEGWHLQEALNYHYLLRALQKKGIVKETAVSVPSMASVFACGVECPLLFQAYGAVGNGKDGLICGIDHSIVNMYGDRYHKHDLSLHMWEYPHKALTKKVEIARIPFEGTLSICGDGVWHDLAFEQAGTCHGIVCWVEYGLRVDRSEKGTDSAAEFERLSTHRQIFRMTRHPRGIALDEVSLHKLECKIRFETVDGLEDHDFDIRIA